MIKKSESLKKTRVGGWENKDNLERMKQTPLRKLRLNLADVENGRIRLKRSTPIEKDWQDNLDDREGLVFTPKYENTIWGRYGINIRLRSNSNTTTQNKTKNWLAE